jgi:hypothetical protein
LAPTVVFGRLNQALDLSLSQVLTGPIRGIGLAHRQSNCARFVAWTDNSQVANGRHFPPLHAMDCAYKTLSSNSCEGKLVMIGESF